MSDSLVDLLLVRLGREEEKKKVMKLLITNLDLSVTEAENAVNNSPSVIREAVPMNEARVIQKDLYPYIDLLPRLEDEPDMMDEEIAEEIEELPEGELPEADIEYTTIETQPASEEDTPQVPAADDDEPIRITTASEEICSTSRCHICGRTPSNGERLAPCRTCSKLTCRDCFDRIAHVCNHCAKDGKTIDRANAGMSTDTEEGLEFDSEELEEKNKVKEKNALRIAAALAFILALAAFFYFMDPMDIFSGDEPDLATDTGAIPVDTLGITLRDSTGTAAALPDDSTEAVEAAADTIEIGQDTLSVNNDLFGVRLITLPENCVPGENPLPVNFHLTSPRDVHADIPEQESEILFSQLETIASSIPVILDDGVFLVFHDTTSVLVLVLLHPEETGVRLQLMREVAAWLIPSEIDQLVLIYRENRYQDAILFSLVREAFPDVEGVLSPRQFQGILGYREDCWESIRGPVTHWLSAME